MKLATRQTAKVFMTGRSQQFGFRRSSASTARSFIRRDEKTGEVTSRRDCPGRNLRRLDEGV